MKAYNTYVNIKLYIFPYITFKRLETMHTRSSGFSANNVTLKTKRIKKIKPCEIPKR